MIKSNKGNVEIEGAGIDVLTDLSMVTYALIKGGIPETILKGVIDTGINRAKKEKKETVEKDNVDIKNILKNIGIEV